MSERTCPTCGIGFEVQDPRVTYCSSECRKNRPCAVDDCASVAVRKGGVCNRHYRSPEAPPTPRRVCPTCGAPFVAVTNKRFCSDECRDNRPCSVDGCERRAASGDLCKNHYYAFRTYGDPLHRRPCAICGDPCDHMVKGQNPTCSDECRSEQGRMRVEKYMHESGRLRKLDQPRRCSENGCYNLVITTDRKGAPRRCDVCLEPIREQALLRRVKRYGITVAQYERLMSSQGAACAVCGTDQPGGKGAWHIDHDHTCCQFEGSCGHCVRGLLCSRCNTAAGLIRDDPAIADAMSAYLRQRRGSHLIV